MSFKYNILHIKSELIKHNKDKQQLSKLYIAKRLNKSLISYKQDLEFRLRYLDQRKPENVLKEL